MAAPPGIIMFVLASLCKYGEGPGRVSASPYCIGVFRSFHGPVSYASKRSEPMMSLFRIFCWQTADPFTGPHRTYTILLGGAATCSEGFVIFFSRSSPPLLGQHGSCSIAQRPVELLENSLPNLRNKWPPHPVFQVTIDLPLLPAHSISHSSRLDDLL